MLNQEEIVRCKTTEGISQYGEGNKENPYSPWSQHEKSHPNKSCHVGGMNIQSFVE